MKYISFVTVVHHVDQNISPYIVSNLLDPFHQTSSSRFFLIIGARSWNDCNSIILDLSVLKLQHVVALFILFPMPLVWSKLDSPRKRYAKYPTVTWLYTSLVERTCMTWHVSQFRPLDLKNVYKKLQSILFL